MNNVKHEQLELYAITGNRWLKDTNLLEKAEQALAAGATFLQYRDKDSNFDNMVSMAKQLKALAVKYNVPFVVDDNVLVAKEADADGVHIGQGDTSFAIARQFLGPDKIIGYTAKNLEQALFAEQVGADYIGVGAIFGAKTTLETLPDTFGTLKEITSAVNIPVVAIGGINCGNIEKLRDTGVSGVAVVSALFASDDVTAATRQLKSMTADIFRYD